MNTDKLIIAGAGSGKTTHLVAKALSTPGGKILITTYTDANEAEIRDAILRENRCVPANITIQTWFSLLLQHGVRPYQGTLHQSLFEKNITGMLLVNQKSGVKYRTKKDFPVCYAETENFDAYYFSPAMKIYSDKISKFISKVNQATSGEIISRLSRIYSHIFVDEVQDLAGYDLDLLASLFKSSSNLLLVGDPRQVTYLTHHERKYGKYRDGMIKNFLLNEISDRFRPEIDESTLNVSHRNHAEVCSYASRLYPGLAPTLPCKCVGCRQVASNHVGIFLVRPTDVSAYLRRHKPMQLRWDIRRSVDAGYPVRNFGEAKGATFERVLIYPTAPMAKWVIDNTYNLKSEARAKLYVAITRAKVSAAVVLNLDSEVRLEGIQSYRSDDDEAD